MDSKIIEREDIIDVVLLEVDVLKICKKFDKLGCMYAPLKDCGRVYRRNNRHYLLNFSKIEIFTHLSSTL